MSGGSSNPFNSLGDESHEQIRKYLKFFRQKRDGIIRTITREFEDVKSDRIHEDVYSREDMEEFADFLSTAIRNQVGADLSSLINMGALSVSQLLESAQDKGVTLSLETAAVENQSLLEAVEKMSLDAIPMSQTKKMGQLTSLKDEARAMKEDLDRQEEENRQLQDELQFVKARLSAAERATNERSSAEGKRSDDSSAASSVRLRALENDLRDAKEEGEKRVAETVQFQQMRRLMQSQAQNIKDLRRRLAKYEPMDAKDEDD